MGRRFNTHEPSLELSDRCVFNVISNIYQLHNKRIAPQSVIRPLATLAFGVVNAITLK
jgi:hypothetical protein